MDHRILRVPGGNKETHFIGIGMGPGSGRGSEAGPPNSTPGLFDHLDLMFYFLHGKGRRGLAWAKFYAF